MTIQHRISKIAENSLVKLGIWLPYSSSLSRSMQPRQTYSPGFTNGRTDRKLRQAINPSAAMLRSGLKIGYVNRLLDNSLGKWKSAAAYFYKTNNIKMYFQSNHAAYKEINHKFYSDIHNFWSIFQTIENPTNIVIQNQTIWNNRYITIENVPYE